MNVKDRRRGSDGSEDHPKKQESLSLIEGNAILTGAAGSRLHISHAGIEFPS